MLTTEKLRIRKGVSQSTDPQTAAAELHEAIHQPGISFALFYCSSTYDLDALGRALAERFADAPLIGCTTAGEITPAGYLQGSLTGISIASEEFTAVSSLISDLQSFEFVRGETAALELLTTLKHRGQQPSGTTTFGFVLIDGLSVQEEAVVSSLHNSIGDIQLFGGSAADDAEFKATAIYHNGKFHSDAAVFTLIHTTHPFMIFKTQHFVATDGKMVVTSADASRRIVFEINGAPACQEYARLVGLEGVELTSTVFAAHPVVVKLGGDYYVRSIMHTNDDDSITFACAIDEGVVLTVAEGVDMLANLKGLFQKIREKIGEPQLILGCDCLFRLIEMDQRGLREAIGEVLRANNVIGFSTYGEQYNGMHINQTFTGAAIGLPRAAGSHDES